MKYEKIFNELDEDLKIKTHFIPTQKELDEMLDILIKRKDKEKIWRLTFTFSDLDLNFDKFIYYYIKEKDSWYLYELFSVITDEKFDDKKLYEYVSKNYNDCLDTFIQAIKDYYGMDYEGYKE